MEDVIEMDACVDCVAITENGETDTPGAAERYEFAAAQMANYHFFVSGDEEDRTDFSWRPCEFCGSTLGGYRDRIIAIPHTIVEGEEI